MPRNAFLGMPRIWFSLRSLNKRKRGTELATRPALSASHYDNKTRAGCLGDCLVSGPRLPQACALFLRDGFCWNGYQGEPLASRAGSVGGLAPPGQEPSRWVICCTHCTQLSVLPPPRDDPLPLLLHVSLPHGRVNTSPSPISQGPAVFVI